ncbi:MAG TPA: DUF72 domain-containing protein [Sumerlaeia bacterium]|nr:DUF72 domain-containing protein [Sumerlaeia bacterium]
MPKPEPSPLRIGTSSWSAPGWERTFYTASAGKSQWIAEYATKFSTVEIDATFYRVPSRYIVERWRDRTPEDFRFAAKAPKVITHDKFLVDCAAELDQFLDAMTILGPRLGPILFQFPYFAKKTEIGPATFRERLKSFLPSLPRGLFQFAVEVRNKTWLRTPLLDLLSYHGVALALIDHPWMPRPGPLFQQAGIITGPFAYIRWLGDRNRIEEITQTWDKTVIDRREDMAEWVAPVKALLRDQVPVFGYFNNHYSGHAPADARAFLQMIENEEN